MAEFKFETIEYSCVNETEFYSLPNKIVNTTKPWIDFIIEDSHAEPIIVRITSNDKFVGYFSCLKIKKVGINIIGSPFSGWSTTYMGFDLIDNSFKVKILPALVEYLQKTQKCAYLQIIERDITMDEANSLYKQYGYQVKPVETLDIGISFTDEELYKHMKTDCRNFIKQFERRGATLEIAESNDTFAEEYYEQLLDVFAKQNLVPTYTVDKVKCLLKHLGKSNNVLCLRVKDREGKSIATSIFPGFNKKCFFWGGASLRSYQQYRPNEYMIYTAMKYWRDRGCTDFDMVGNRAYKKKFGSWEVTYPCIVVSKYKILYTFKEWAAKLYYFSGNVLWNLHIKR